MSANALREQSEPTDLLITIEGAMAAACIDWKAGVCVWSIGDEAVDMNALVARGLNMIRTRAAGSTELNDSGRLEDILITFGQHFHILHICDEEPSRLIYLVLDRDSGNLALARHQMAELCNFDGSAYQRT